MHCTASRGDADVESVRAVFRARGWKRPGYHYVIDASGEVTQLLDESLTANGVRGYNATSVHVAYIGGIDAGGRPADTRTEAQRRALRTVVAGVLSRHPDAEVLGHRDISPDTNGNGIVDPWERIKECPCFDVKNDL